MNGLSGQIKAVWNSTLSGLFADFAQDVSIEVLDKEANVVDGLYGESDGVKRYKPAVSVKARIKLGKDRVVLPGGEAHDADARVTFRTDELREKNLVLDFGSRVSFGAESFVVVHLETRCQVANDFLLTRAYLQRE